ncbi:MAG: HD domain-containing protein [Candidatus Sumerlaeaceae bacterium]|nr:HD domain-containing protein [Candidatus Sumerlaeaceae bacterium]
MRSECGAYIQSLKHTLLAHARYRWSSDQLLNAALEVAEAAHRHQRRDGGEPYIIHPLRVALNFLLVHPHATEAMLVVALLHDVMEDAHEWTRQRLAAVFGTEVADGVERLSKVTHERELSAEEYKRLIINSPHFIRLIKLCDRLDNIISLRHCPDEVKVRRYLNKTEAYYREIARDCDEDLLRVILEEIEIIKKELAKSEKPTG